MNVTDALFGGPVAANDNFRKCERCDGPLPSSKRNGAGRPRKFCSDACRLEPVFKNDDCVFCGKEIAGRKRRFCDQTCRTEYFKKSSRDKPKYGHEIVTGKCPECGIDFIGRVGKIYCSRNCARRRRDENYDRYKNAPERQCQWCSATFNRRPNAKDAALYCSRSCSQEYLRASSAVVRPVKFTVFRSRCFICEMPFTANSSLTKYCSIDCSAEVNRLKSRERSVANDNVDRSPRPCAECGEVFSPSYGEKNRKFCSGKCSKKNGHRSGKLKRKAALRAAFVESVDPIKVFIRDKWKCQICGIKTPRKLRGTLDDRAPELDHIMPLSLGGAHSYMNTQCACRKCNGRKSDTPPDRIGLFAYAA